ncbi:MAG: hypothetical protein FWH42_03940, partial [Dehalococcoidia bacterium]|nr:hypothetical protein [Dehalococcoidia bacterium]
SLSQTPSRARDENPIILCQSGGMTGRYLRRIFRPVASKAIIMLQLSLPPSKALLKGVDYYA